MIERKEHMTHTEHLLEIIENRIAIVERELQALRRTLYSIRTEGDVFSITSVDSNSVQEIDIDCEDDDSDYIINEHQL